MTGTTSATTLGVGARQNEKPHDSHVSWGAADTAEYRAYEAHRTARGGQHTEPAEREEGASPALRARASAAFHCHRHLAVTGQGVIQPRQGNPPVSRSYVSVLSRNSWGGLRETVTIHVKGATMFSTGEYQVVVTYRDGSGLWKDRPVAHEYLKGREVSPQEREVDCFIPSFWKSVPRLTRIVHVGFTGRV